MLEQEGFGIFHSFSFYFFPRAVLEWGCFQPENSGYIIFFGNPYTNEGYRASGVEQDPYCVGPHEIIMVVIGLLPQCGLFIDFSGEALLGLSLFRCLSCKGPLGSSGPFCFRFVPQIIGKDLGCGGPCPSKNPSRPARLTAA